MRNRALTPCLLYRYPRVERAIEGGPTALIRDGRVLSKNLAREAITKDELMEAIRKQGLGSIEEVAEATMETGGVISVVPRMPSAAEERLHPVVGQLKEIQEELAVVHRLLLRSGGVERS